MSVNVYRRIETRFQCITSYRDTIALALETLEYLGLTAVMVVISTITTIMAKISYTHEYGEKTVRVGVHCDGAAHEPRVRWQVGDRSGESGYVHLDTQKPVIRLEEGETVRLQDRSVAEIPVPRTVGKALDDQIEGLGTITVENERLATDPTSFPSDIDGFQRIGWEDGRSVMWYWRDSRSTPRAYQIVNHQLVFRAQEWADPAVSKHVLVDRYKLSVNP